MTFNAHSIPEFFRNHGLSFQGEKVIVAYSGGLDSVVLAFGVTALSQKYNLELHLAHVNHDLRVDADENEEHCRQTAKAWGVPLFVHRLDPRQRAGGVSVEAWARQERYGWLENLRTELSAAWILTAHHAQDQAETVLMRLVQGGGLLSCAGIRPVLGRIVRPMLVWRKADLRAYAKKHSLSWREDPTNTDRRYFRNEIRHGLLKTAMDQQRDAIKMLTGLAEFAQGYEQELAALAGQVLLEAQEGWIPGSLGLSQSALNALEDDAFKLVVRGAINRLGKSAPQLKRAHWQTMRHFVRQSHCGKVFEITADVRLLKDRDHLWVYIETCEHSPDATLLHPGENPWGCHSFNLRKTSDKPEPILKIRSWRAGDRVSLGKAKGRRKVSDIFTDKKLNRLEKQHWPVVADSHDEVLWVPGLMAPPDVFEQQDWSLSWKSQIQKH